MANSREISPTSQTLSMPTFSPVMQKALQVKCLTIGCGQQTSINTLVGLIGEMMETDAKPVYTASRPGDVRHSCADIHKAQQLLGYEPKVELKAGLRRTIDWFLQRCDA